MAEHIRTLTIPNGDELTLVDTSKKLGPKLNENKVSIGPGTHNLVRVTNPTKVVKNHWLVLQHKQTTGLAESAIKDWVNQGPGRLLTISEELA